MTPCKTQLGHGKNDYCDKPAVGYWKDKRNRNWPICTDCIANCDEEQKQRVTYTQLSADGAPKGTKSVTFNWSDIISK